MFESSSKSASAMNGYCCFSLVIALLLLEIPEKEG
jgi:hypothetical protein